MAGQKWVLRALSRSHQPLEGNTRHGTKDNVHRRKGKSARKSKAREAGKELGWEGVSRWQGLHLRRPSPFSTGQKEDPATRGLGHRHCRDTPSHGDKA